jgi:hypothetical protein
MALNAGLAQAILEKTIPNKEGNMPSIISTPVKTRRNSRAMEQTEVEEFVTAMRECDETQSVLVEGSEAETYEKAYVRGERIRTYAKRYDLLKKGEKVTVIAFQQDEKDGGQWVASVRLVKA